MSTLTIPNSFLPNTPAIAVDVNANFAAVKTFAEGLADGTQMDADFLVASHISDAVIAYLASDSELVISAQVFS